MPAVLTGDVASVLSDGHVDAGWTQARGCFGGRAGLPVGHTVPCSLEDAKWTEGSSPACGLGAPGGTEGLSPGPSVTEANVDRCCGQWEAASSCRGQITAIRRACELLNIGSH